MSESLSRYMNYMGPALTGEGEHWVLAKGSIARHVAGGHGAPHSDTKWTKFEQWQAKEQVQIAKGG